MKRVPDKKGIFSLQITMKEDSSTESIFSSSNTWYSYGGEHRHFSVWKKEDIELHLKEWKKKEVREYFPILLLSFHPKEFDEMWEWMLPMDELVGHLSDDAPNKAIIHISSHIHVEDDEMEDFLKKTGALSVSVSGYTSGKRYGSEAFDLLFPKELFLAGPPSSSIEMRDFVDECFVASKKLKALAELLGFHMWYRDDEYNLNTNDHPDYITPCPVEG